MASDEPLTRWLRRFDSSRVRYNLRRHGSILKSSICTLMRITFSLTCVKCGTQYQLEMTPREHERGKFRKHCTQSCANGHLVTEAHRCKTRASLLGRSFPNRRKVFDECVPCTVCGTSFTRKTTSQVKTCGRKCQNQLQSRLAIDRLKKGLVRSRSVRCVFDFHGVPIRCDSLMEYSCLDWCVKTLSATLIKRSELVLTYDDQGTVRRYIPDFEIINDEGTTYVECKALDMGSNLSQKWHKYLHTASLKKSALEQHCKSTNTKMIWFVAHTMHGKFYKEITAKYRRGEFESNITAASQGLAIEP